MVPLSKWSIKRRNEIGRADCTHVTGICGIPSGEVTWEQLIGLI